MFPGLILDREQLADAVKQLRQVEAFAFDIESVGPRRGHPVYNEVTWISLATYGFGAAIPMGHPNGDVLLAPAVRRKDRATGKFVDHPPLWNAPPAQLSRDQVFEALGPLLHSDRIKVAHNASIDLVSVAKYLPGGIPTPPYFDTIVGVWLLDENLRSKKLKDLITSTYGVTYDHEQTGKRVERHSISAVGRYGYFDAKYTWLLYRRVRKALSAAGLDELMDLEMKVLSVVAHMRKDGAHVDEKALALLDEQVTRELDDAREKLFAAAGRTFNLNSVPQKQALLYGKPHEGGFGLKPLLPTKGGAAKAKLGAKLTIADYSTSAEALEPYADRPIVQALEHYQELETMESTYVRSYLGTPDKLGVLINSRIHTDFVQYGTRTGRFSSRDPNLQNVPRPGEKLAAQVRSLFTAPDGCKLVVADYGQIELRVLAHYLGEGALYDGFHAGIDAHTATAMLVFGVEIDGVTKGMRQVAKAINFAIVFGAGPARVAAMAKISLAEAKHILDVHRARFPEIYQFKQAVIDTCRSRQDPHITTLLGRHRRLPQIRYRNPELRSMAERQAVNSLIQGSAGDLIKFAMVRLHPKLHSGMRLVLTVHDELVTETPVPLAQDCAAIMREAMLGEGIQKLLSVPLTSDAVICDSWAEAK
jgi:DNA polymerase I-like protein with 3'-5' exonuclease and polymerase domains